MIRLQLDILPHGDIASKDPVAEINVALVSVDNKTQNAEYEVTLYYKTKKGSYRITGVKHNRMDGIFVLMEEVFRAIEKELLSEKLKSKYLYSK